MYTRCPTCSTCFRVTDRHLAIAKGKVRCGKCQLVFNAPDHAIDDLPANQVTPTPATPKPKPEIKKPVVTKPVKKEDVIKPAKKIKPKKTVVKKSITPMAPPIFDADIDNIGLDKPTTSPEDITVMNDDEVFDDSFDLDAAIDELTQATDEIVEHDKPVSEVKEEKATNTKQYTPTENNHGDVFKTDAYDATNASSVTDILNEMEDQLSLDISKPEVDKDYDANDEFQFLELDDEIQENSENNHPKLKINIPENENIIDEDALFDQIDVNDFQESEPEEEDIVIEDLQQQNIGQHAGDEVPFQLRNDIESLQAAPLRHLHPMLSASLIVVLLVLSFSQLAYFRAHELVNLIPATRPLLEAFCDKVNCHYSGPLDTKKIQLTSRDVRLHPKEKKALLISAAMINNATFAQPYPKIHIRLSDISGNVIAERIFNTKTYMGKLNNPFLLMKPNTPVHINFEVVDPGKDAINFEFTFL